MSVRERDLKLLWGRAAGRCSNPDCRAVLTDTGFGEESYLTGEMAHLIASSPSGPRGAGSGGADGYDNLILLCASCHRKIDKAPEGTFTVEQLKEWKEQHEYWVSSLGDDLTFPNLFEFGMFVSEKLLENKSCFDGYGPKSDLAQNNPGSESHRYWEARKFDTIIPNNKVILKSVESNKGIITPKLRRVFVEFKLHAIGFEQNQYERMEKYPLFPERLQEVLEEECKL